VSIQATLAYKPKLYWPLFAVDCCRPTTRCLSHIHDKLRNRSAKIDSMYHNIKSMSGLQKIDVKLGFISIPSKYMGQWRLTQVTWRPNNSYNTIVV